VLVTRMYPANTAEPIEMPFGELTHVGPRNHSVLDEGWTNALAAVRGDKTVMEPCVKIIWPLVLFLYLPSGTVTGVASSIVSLSNTTPPSCHSPQGNDPPLRCVDAGFHRSVPVGRWPDVRMWMQIESFFAVLRRPFSPQWLYIPPVVNGRWPIVTSLVAGDNYMAVTTTDRRVVYIRWNTVAPIHNFGTVLRLYNQTLRTHPLNPVYTIQPLVQPVVKVKK